MMMMVMVAMMMAMMVMATVVKMTSATMMKAILVVGPLTADGPHARQSLRPTVLTIPICGPYINVKLINSYGIYILKRKNMECLRKQYNLYNSYIHYENK